MRPHFHPHPVNDAFSDPALYIDFQFEKRAILFDLGEIGALNSRKILRISDIFISHTHMDHFCGFDRVLRFCVGRPKSINIYGPQRIIDHVEHKLASYTWNLLGNYPERFALTVHEYHGDGPVHRAEFSTKNDFRRRDLADVACKGGILLREHDFHVRAVVLDHKVPCLAFSLQEPIHVNVWKNRLQTLGLPVGPWLRELKKAVLEGRDDATAIPIYIRISDRPRAATRSLGDLKQRVLECVPGQKISYVVDCSYCEPNQTRIIDLARHAEILFIEAGFMQADAGHAAQRCHLTAGQAGALARRAEVKRAVPFHFSTRYLERPTGPYAEFEQALRGAAPTAIA